MTHSVIGLIGSTGAGKTAIARHLVEQSGYTNVHMGRPLKDMLLALGLTERDVAGSPADRAAPQKILGGKTTRFAMQTLGTDWGRRMMTEGIWANATQVRIEQLMLKPNSKIVVDDVRFPNDWTMIQQLGGVIIKIRRPGFENFRSRRDVLAHRLGFAELFQKRPVFGWSPIHETEFHWPDAPGIELVNDTNVEEVAAKVLSVAVTAVSV